MPLETRDEVALKIGTAWEQNATRLGSIPLHPLGEISYYTFVNMARTEEDRINSWITVFRQLIITATVTCIFVHNAITSIGLVRAKPRALATWCSLIQSLAGVACGLYACTLIFPEGLTCRGLLWAIMVCIRVNDFCTGATLLQKAYIVRHRNRWLLLFIPLIVVAPIPIIYASWISPAILSSSAGGCVFVYPVYYPWMRFAFHAPINLVLTGIFLQVAIAQYRKFGNDAWRKLTRDGIQIGLALLFLNVACTFAVGFEIFGIYSVIVLLVEW
jgi:hypothetical protein